MPENPNSNWDLQSLVTAAIALLSFLGGGVAWWIISGMPALANYRKRKQELRVKELESLRSVDFKTMLLEDKTLHAAHKSMLLMQEARISTVEEEIRELRKDHNLCLEAHAAAEQRYNTAERKVECVSIELQDARVQLHDAKKKYDSLDKRFNRLRSTLKLEPDENGGHLEIKLDKEGEDPDDRQK
jgi:chromosome segregation ATPase